MNKRYFVSMAAILMITGCTSIGGGYGTGGEAPAGWAKLICIDDATVALQAAGPGASGHVGGAASSVTLSWGGTPEPAVLERMVDAYECVDGEPVKREGE